MYGPWQVADHEGLCAGCGYDYMTSDVVRPDGEAGWLCWVCGNDDEGRGP